MKIKWEVEAAPTGPYRTFVKRGWPVGRADEDGFVFFVRCEDQYVPAKVKTGEHGPLRLAFRDERERGAHIRVFTREFKTLAEVKEFAAGLERDRLIKRA